MRTQHQTNNKPAAKRVSRKWMKDEAFLAHCDGMTVNVMKIAEKMTKKHRVWGKALFTAQELSSQHARDVYRRYGQRHWASDRGADNKTWVIRQWPSHDNQRPISEGKAIMHAETCLPNLWNNTVRLQGVRRCHDFGPACFSYNRRSATTGMGGRGSSTYGAHVYGTPSAYRGGFGDLLEVILHELCHYVHLSVYNFPIINGKARAHDLMFNHLLCEMARKLWGYDKWPEDAGWSVGRGYAPSRDLEQWLGEQIKLENPRVMRWLIK